MKRAFCLVFCITLFTLAGCGGGGGGGSSNVVSGFNGLSGGEKGASIGVAAYDNATAVAPENVSTVSDPTKLDNTASTEVSLYKDIENSVTVAEVSKTADGFKLVLSEEYDNDLPAATVEWVHFKELNTAAEYEAITGSPASRYHGEYNFSAEVLPAAKIKGNDNGESYEGVFTVVHALALGGKKLGLEYSDFGAWISVDFFDGTLNDKAHKGKLNEEMTGFAYGDVSKKIGFTAGSGVQDFTGNALACAYNWDVDEAANLFGTAKLSVDLANLAASQLDLDFKDFYKFSVTNIGLQNDGSMNTNGASVAVTGGSNQTGTSMALGAGSFQGPQDYVSVNGQFYGVGSPSEASGTFKFRDGNNRVQGAFGVKK